MMNKKGIEWQKKIDSWYKSCEFVEDFLCFYSYKDFLENKNILKRNFTRCGYKERHLYMYYVFSKGNISQAKKEYIWEFLNAPEDIVL